MTGPITSSALNAVQASLASLPQVSPREYAPGLIKQFGGLTKPDYGKIVGQLEALLQSKDPAVQEFGRAVEREVVSQLSDNKPVKIAQVEKALYNATYTAGNESFSRSGMTIEARRASAEKSPNIKNPDYVEYMKHDRAYGDGKWATNDSAKIGDAWRSKIASGAKTDAQFAGLVNASSKALDSAIANWQTQFSPAGIRASVGDSLLKGLTQSERLSGSDMAQNIGLLLRKGPQIQLAFQVGMAKGVAGAAWGMVSSIAVLAGKAVQYTGDTAGFGVLGALGDAARSATPEWVKDGLRAIGADDVIDAAVPSYTRGVESTKALNTMMDKAATYFKTHSAEQMGQDVLAALGKKWDSLKGEFAALNGDPVKQAEWLGEKAGAVLFEVATTVVPITKLGTAAKAADAAADVARGLDKIDDVADVARGAGKIDTPPVTTLAKIIAARKALATEFYLRKGFDADSIPDHIKGIDFTKPVDVVPLKAGTKVYQYQVPGGRQGNYYSNFGIKAEQLGIAGQGIDRATGKTVDKIVTAFILKQDVDVLRSTASAVKDTWSLPGKSVSTIGGGIQMFSPEKALFEAVK